MPYLYNGYIDQLNQGLANYMQDDTKQSNDQYYNPVDGKTYIAEDGWHDYSPQNPQPTDPNTRVKLDNVRLLTDQTTIAANVDIGDLSNYIKAIVTVLNSATSEAQTPFQLILQFELKPHETVYVQIASQGEVSDDILQKVYDAILSVESPQPRQQSIAFQSTISVNPTVEL